MAPEKGTQARMIATLVRLFDVLRTWWDQRETSRRVAAVLILFFLVSTASVLLNRFGFLPERLSGIVPTDLYASIRLAFSLILAIEVLELIFALADSVSLAVGKQLEIMALLLLRESFADISLLNAQIDPAGDWPVLLQVGTTAVCGLALFGIRILFARWHYVHSYKDMRGYVDVKKCICLFLLCTFIGALLYDLHMVIMRGNSTVFFQIFYTTLIFTDILLVLVGQYFTPSFQATFRNSGFAVSTLLMRLALGAPHHVGALLCVFAGGYLLSLSWALARFTPMSVGPIAVGIRADPDARPGRDKAPGVPDHPVS